MLRYYEPKRYGENYMLARAVSLIPSYKLPFWNSPSYQADTSLVDITKEKFNPKSERHISFIDKKVKAFNTNYETLQFDVKHCLWPVFLAYYIFKNTSLIFSPFMLAALTILDQIYVPTQSLLPDAIARAPVHVRSLKELDQICGWIAKDQDASITNNRSFMEVVSAIHMLVPLNHIPFSDLNAQEPRYVNPDFIQLLSLPPHNLVFPGMLKDVKEGSMEKKCERASQSVADFKYALFGLGSEKGYFQAKAVAEKVIDLLPVTLKK